MEDEKIIARIPRSASNECLIKTFTYWNKKVVDVRWYSNGKPSSKGFRCNMDEAKTLALALNKIIGDNNEKDDDKQKSNEDFFKR